MMGLSFPVWALFAGVVGLFFLISVFNMVNRSLEAVVWVSIFFVVLCHMWRNDSCDLVEDG